MYGTQTQREAYEFVKPTLPTQRERVYSAIESMGTTGATDEQIRKLLGIDQRAASARRLELERLGRVYWRGDERVKDNGLKSMVWVVADYPHVPRRKEIDNTFCSHCGRGASL